MELAVEEMVTERTPPHRKVWETIGSPKLFVIGHYRMGFEVTPQGQASRLRVFIDYALPERVPGRWLGRLFGRYYARWCTQQMVDDAVKYCASVSRDRTMGRAEIPSIGNIAAVRRAPRGPRGHATLPWPLGATVGRVMEVAYQPKNR
jgi:hypothetical protein